MILDALPVSVGSISQKVDHAWKCRMDACNIREEFVYNASSIIDLLEEFV